MMREGEKVWKALIAEGGFVWSHSDGSKTIHFNAGCKPSRELLCLVKARKDSLKKYVDCRHENELRQGIGVRACGFSAPGLGSSAHPKEAIRNREGLRN
jgi:hypothetical protein